MRFNKSMRATIVVRYRVSQDAYTWLCQYVSPRKAEEAIRKLFHDHGFFGVEWRTFAYYPETEEISEIHLDDQGSYERDGWLIYEGEI